MQALEHEPQTGEHGHEEIGEEELAKRHAEQRLRLWKRPEVQECLREVEIAEPSIEEAATRFVDAATALLALCALPKESRENLVGIVEDIGDLIRNRLQSERNDGS